MLCGMHSKYVFTKLKFILVYSSHSSPLRNRHAHCFSLRLHNYENFWHIGYIENENSKPELMVKTKVILFLEGKMGILSLALN